MIASTVLLLALAQNPPLRVAMTGNYWPLHAGEGDTRHGFEAELAQALAAQLGRELKFFGRQELGVTSMEAITQNKVDIAISAITPTDERRKQVDFTKPYLMLHYRVLHDAKAPPLTKVEELEGKRVAVPKGPAMVDLKERLASSTVVEVPGVGQGVKLLKKKKVDYVAGENIALMDFLEGGAVAMTGPALGWSPLALATPKGLADSYNAALEKLAPVITKLEATYKPGLELETLTFSPCTPSQFVTISAKDAKTFVAAKPAADARWFFFDRDVGYAAPFEPPADGMEGFGGICVNEPVRITKVLPAAKKAAAKAVKDYRRSAEKPEKKIKDPDNMDIQRDNKKLVLDESAFGWVPMANGMLVGVAPYTLEKECYTMDILETGADSPNQYEERQRWSCSEGGFFFVAVRPTKTEWGLMTTQDEAPAP